MINENLEQFLDTGWYNEASLYYKGYVYWCEGFTEAGTNTFFIVRWKAEKQNDVYYNSYVKDGRFVGCEKIFEIHGDDMDMLKRQFLEAPVFDSKNFWQAESEIVWLDEGDCILT